MEGSILYQCSGFKRVLQGEEDGTDRCHCGGSLGLGRLLVFVGLYRAKGLRSSVS